MDILIPNMIESSLEHHADRADQISLTDILAEMTVRCAKPYSLEPISLKLQMLVQMKVS